MSMNFCRADEHRSFKSGRKFPRHVANKIDIDENGDNPKTSKIHAVHKYREHYKYPNIKNWKVRKWLQKFIGKNINTVFSKFIQQLKTQNSKEFLGDAKQSFWNIFEKKENIKPGTSGYYLNPDNTIGFYRCPKPKTQTDPKLKEYNDWNQLQRNSIKNFSQLFKSAIKEPTKLGVFFIHSGNDVVKKEVYILLNDTYLDSLSYPEEREGHVYELNDKDYFKIQHDWKKCHIYQLGSNIIQNQRKGYWNINNMPYTKNVYIFLVKK